MFRTVCPFCGTDGRLTVVSGRFYATGMWLTEDGFAFADAKQLDTEEEEVRCGACGQVFPLDRCYADAEAAADT
jgi:uncharacterized protein YbaR (Trm112 family)